MKLLTSIPEPALSPNRSSPNRLSLKRPASPANPALRGTGAALLTVTIWAGWIVATRFAGETAISPITTGLFRYGPPALLLSPVSGPPFGPCLVLSLRVRSGLMRSHVCPPSFERCTYCEVV